jgi:hypothetical protein
MRLNTANSSLVSGSGLVLSIYQICAYGSRDQAEFVAKINQIQSAMDTRKPSVTALQFGKIKDRPEAVRYTGHALSWQRLAVPAGRAERAHNIGH